MPENPPLPTESLHGTIIAYQGAGCMILGESGTGKSRLAIEAMTMGAKLVGDDRVTLTEIKGMLAGQPAEGLSGVVEMRGFGLIRLNDTLAKHILHLVVELGQGDYPRYPEKQTREYLGMQIPYLRLPAYPQTSAIMLLMYLRAMQEGRILPPDWMPGKK